MKTTILKLALVLSLGCWAGPQTAPASTSNNTQTSPQALQITQGPITEYITDTMAIVAWSTNTGGSSVVHYGTDQNNLNLTAQSPYKQGSSTHRVRITGLQPGTTYYFQVDSGQGEGTGTEAKSSVMNFKTTAPGATPVRANNALPGEMRILAGPVAQNVTGHSANIFWMTSGNAVTSLKYGLNQNNPDQTATPEAASAGPNGNREHRVKLSNLQPNQTYYYQVLTKNGNMRASGQFQTMPSDYAQNNQVVITDGPVFEYLDSNSAQIAWTTNVRSSTTVRYGIDPNALNKTAQAPWGQQTHRVKLTNLQPNTKYFFVVESAQAQGTGTMAKGNEGSFQTENQGEAALNNIESPK